MADRSALSPVGAGLAGLSRATSLTGILVRDVISSTVPWAKANPVMAPHVLRLTSAVACCQVGFLRGGTDSPPFSFALALAASGQGALSSVSGSLLHVRQRLENRLELRITWVIGVGEQHPDVVGRGGRGASPPLPVRVRDQRGLPGCAGHRLRTLAGGARLRGEGRRA